MKESTMRFLEKFAQDMSVNGNKVFSFSDVKDVNVKNELELIQNYKLYNDIFALERLISLYRGTINNCVNNSKVKKLAGYEQTYQRAVNALKACVKNYKLDSYNKNKPVTYFTTNIMLELDKFYKQLTSQSTVKMSSELNRNKNLMVNAEDILKSKLGRKPSNEEILNFIHEDFGMSKNLDLKTMERIQHYNTMEYSGSQMIGHENADGAESITFEDVVNKTKSADDVIKSEQTESKVIDAIRSFTNSLSERRFLMAYYGIGEYKNKSELKGNVLKSARECGTSYYLGNVKLNQFAEYCSKNGII